MTKPLTLIIEDDERLANIYARVLELDGLDVELVFDGEIAVNRLTVTEPAVVVLDLQLPNVSGQEILHHIRVDKRLVRTPVVVVSGDLSTAEEVRNNVDLVLSKPVKATLLRKAIAKVLFRHSGFRPQMASSGT